MFRLVCLLALCSGSLAASIGRVESSTEKREIVPLLRFETDKKPDGSFSFSFEGGDQSFREETGVLENAGTDDEALEVTGSYRYIDADGQLVEVHYTAGRNGFVPIGTNILSEISALAKAAGDLPNPSAEEELEAQLKRKSRSNELQIPVTIVLEEEKVKEPSLESSASQPIGVIVGTKADEKFPEADGSETVVAVARSLPEAMDKIEAMIKAEVEPKLGEPDIAEPVLVIETEPMIAAPAALKALPETEVGVKSLRVAVVAPSDEKGNEVATNSLPDDVLADIAVKALPEAFAAAKTLLTAFAGAFDEKAADDIDKSLTETAAAVKSLSEGVNEKVPEISDKSLPEAVAADVAIKTPLEPLVVAKPELEAEAADTVAAEVSAKSVPAATSDEKVAVDATKSLPETSVATKTLPEAAVVTSNEKAVEVPSKSLAEAVAAETPAVVGKVLPETIVTVELEDTVPSASKKADEVALRSVPLVNDKAETVVSIEPEVVPAAASETVAQVVPAPVASVEAASQNVEKIALKSLPEVDSKVESVVSVEPEVAAAAPSETVAKVVATPVAAAQVESGATPKESS